MTPADLELPDDVDALKAMILAMAAKAARADVLEDEVADLKARKARWCADMKSNAFCSLMLSVMPA
ncbi:hypothetical protein [Rhizobium leguminosarum]|uniref:hypothetical protein n=1 Tax=Rhizobium leguminosarum TaxID=384 RepID=UPI001AE8686A|nr:hypothetical protein [Rhizobium leguminosarum]MBP2449507.1 hypothetical protein [Rhizobium leguminosarum]